LARAKRLTRIPKRNDPRKCQRRDSTPILRSSLWFAGMAFDFAPTKEISI